MLIHIAKNTLLRMVAAAILMSALSQPLFGNPFTGGSSPDRTAPSTEQFQTENTRSTEPAAIETQSIPQGIRRLTNALPARIQRRFNQRLAELMDSGQNQERGTLLLVAGIAFLYGLIHAALPGHRKTLLLGYFLASDSKPRHAVIAGAGTAILHAGSGAVVVLTAWFILQASVTAAVDSATEVIQQVTAGVAVLIGATLLWGKVREYRRYSNGHSDPADHDEKPPGKLANWISRGRMLPAIVLSATIPCPGSAMILLFALAVGSLTIGLVAVSMFALGMGFTLITFCMIAVLGKNTLIEHMHGRAGHLLHESIEVVAAVAIIVFGIYWMIAGAAVY